MKAYIYKNNKQPFYYATYDVEKRHMTVTTKK